MSNRLPVLLNEIKSANVVFEQAKRMTADAIIVMGERLLEAKDLCVHGEWQDFLRECRIPLRSAQRYMRVVQAGMDTEYLQVVGLAGALEEIDEAQRLMPLPSQAILSVWEGEVLPDIMLWWNAGRLRAGYAQVYTYAEGRTSAYICESMPVLLVAFLVKVFARGLWLNEPRLELSSRVLDQDELSEKLAVIRAGMSEAAE